MNNKINHIISKNASKLFFDKHYFKNKTNISPLIKHTLYNIKKSKRTLIESDKTMGDVYIDSINLDKAALKILKSNNFHPISDTEQEISKFIYSNTIHLWNSHKKNIKPHLENNINFYKWSNLMKKIEKSHKLLSIPNLRPMIKLHKEEIDWRRVLNASNWYSSFFSKFLHHQLELMINTLSAKTNTFIILQNSYHLINDFQKINGSKTSFINNERLLFSFDVKSLYDSLNLEQCVDVLNQLNDEFLMWNPWILNFLIDIIYYFQNNTVVKYKKHIYQMVNGIGTGFSHSGSLANIVLFYFEIKNRNYTDH